MSDTHKRIVYNPIGWIIGTLVGMVLISYILSLTHPFKVTYTKVDVQEVVIDGSIEVCRTIDYNRDARVILDRSYIRYENGVERRLEGETTSITRDKGLYKVCRKEFLPRDIEIGNWEVITATTYKYGIWEHSFYLEPIPIKVIEQRR